MKSSKLLLLLLASFCLHVSAQKNQIKEVKGSDFKPKKIDLTYFFQNAIKAGDNYYVIARKYDYVARPVLIYPSFSVEMTDFKVYKLDSRMNVKGVENIPGEIMGRYVHPYMVRKFGDNLLVLYYFNNTKTLRQYIFAQKINIKTFKTIGSPYKLAETQISKREKQIGCIFDISITPDNMKMLITADRTNIWQSRRERKAAAQQKNHTFSYWLIDEEFKLIASAKNVKFGKGHTDVISQVFDNKGNVCLIGFESSTKEKKKKKILKEDDDAEDRTDDNDSKLIMKIIHPGGESKDLTFANGEYFYSATMRLNPNTGNVAVIGLKGSGYYGANGIFTAQVNLSTGDIISENSNKFTQEMLDEINGLKPPKKSKDISRQKKVKESKKNAKKNNPKKTKDAKLTYIPTFVRINAIHYTDSNELIVVGQKYYSYTVTYTTTSSKGVTTTYTVTYYVYGDLISFKLNEAGEILNYGFVFNYYVTTAYTGRFSSSLYVNDKLYIITRSGGGQIKLENTVSELQPLKEQDTYQKSRYMYQDFLSVSENEMIFVLASRRKFLFTLMSVKVD